MPTRAIANPTAPELRRGALAILCAGAAFCGGCFTKKPVTSPMAHVVLAHPIVPAREQMAAPDAPEIYFGESEPAPRLVIPRNAPARPRVAPAPAPEPSTREKITEPLIAPELSPEQLAAARQATQESLAIAERNLNVIQGKTLTPTQQDVISKIRGFADSAREAIKNNDWQRARSQAKKAEVLSQEFAPQP